MQRANGRVNTGIPSSCGHDSCWNKYSLTLTLVQGHAQILLLLRASVADARHPLLRTLGPFLMDKSINMYAFAYSTATFFKSHLRFSLWFRVRQPVRQTGLLPKPSLGGLQLPHRWHNVFFSWDFPDTDRIHHCLQTMAEERWASAVLRCGQAVCSIPPSASVHFYYVIKTVWTQHETHYNKEPKKNVFFYPASRFHIRIHTHAHTHSPQFSSLHFPSA